MRTHLPRVWAAVLATTVLVALAPATNVAAWSTTCNDTTRRICLWKDADYGLPKATHDAKVPSYSDEGNYPNTNDQVHNSVTSIRNMFAGTDVRFYDLNNYSSLLRCVGEGEWVDNVGAADNDKISSHEKGTGWC